LVLTGLGLVTVVRTLGALRPVRAVAFAAVGLIALFGLLQFTKLAVRWADTPLENYKTVGSIVDSSRIGPVFTNSENLLPFDYYLKKVDVSTKTPAQLKSAFCSAPGPYVYIFRPAHAEPVDTTCLIRRPVFRVRVLQRTRGGYLDIFFVGHRTSSGGEPE